MFRLSPSASIFEVLSRVLWKAMFTFTHWNLLLSIYGHSLSGFGQCLKCPYPLHQWVANVARFSPFKSAVEDKKMEYGKNGLPFPLSFVIITVRRIFRAGGFTARLCRFIPKGLKNPPALNIRICNAFRITNPDIRCGRIANPSERKIANPSER